MHYRELPTRSRVFEFRVREPGQDRVPPPPAQWESMIRVPMELERGQAPVLRAPSRPPTRARTISSRARSITSTWRCRPLPASALVSRHRLSLAAQSASGEASTPRLPARCCPGQGGEARRSRRHYPGVRDLGADWRSLEEVPRRDGSPSAARADGDGRTGVGIGGGLTMGLANGRGTAGEGGVLRVGLV